MGLFWDVFWIKTQELNQVLTSEYIYLLATVEALTEDSFNCDKCKSQYKMRKDAETMTYKRRKLQGCFDYETRKYQIHGVEFSTCPGNFYSSSVFQMLDMMHKYQAGIMPYPGSWADQPAKLIESLQILDGMIKIKRSKKEEEEAKRQKRHEKIRSRR